mmetsp:Transcript_101783/g.285277  ORF Transcript_101783/g.285277 Transcript_101783/m.285277 type:complete len:124 (+) Transcript_101783:90-461(+)
MGEDPKKPEEIFRSGIKSIVSSANKVLGSLEEVAKPVGSAWETVKTQSGVVKESAVYTYQRRHEFPLEIIGGSALLGGGTMLLRRGKIAGVLGAATFGGAAYAVVYDEINLQELPDMIFGKKK